MSSYRKKGGRRIVLAWPSGNLQQKQNRMRREYCLDQREEESARPAQQREGRGGGGGDGGGWRMINGTQRFILFA